MRHSPGHRLNVVCQLPSLVCTDDTGLLGRELNGNNSRSSKEAEAACHAPLYLLTACPPVETEPLPPKAREVWSQEKHNLETV